MQSDAVHSRRDALLAVSRSLGRMQTESAQACRSFANGISQALNEARSTLRVRQDQLRAAEAALAAAGEFDNLAALRREVELAQSRVKFAENAVREITQQHGTFHRSQARFSGLINELVGRGQADIRALDATLGAYIGGGGRGSAGSQSSSQSRIGTALGSTSMDNVLGQRGLQNMDVDLPDFSDNPIISWQHASKPDIRWAVEKWDSTVGPAFARGETRDDLAARDAASGVQPSSMRSLAKVWDVFLGDNSITLTRRPNGSLDVQDGRHRIAVARELGVRHLPMRII